MTQGEIILYQPDNKSTQLEVRIDEETVWLSLHINHIYKEGELRPDSTVKEYLTVQNEGSIKDLGKKWFAFSRIDLDVPGLIKRLQ